MRLNNILIILIMLNSNIGYAGPEKRVKVCVIDTGVDVTHPELKNHICANPHSSEYGWDFVANHKNPNDIHGHGTHVAGIIVATSPNACLIPVKYFEEGNSGEQNLRNFVKSIRYCILRRAKVINYSGGGAEFDLAENKVIRETNKAGILFVTAAGNEGKDLGRAKYYPASYHTKNMLSVAATGVSGRLIPLSNWGLRDVQVAALGKKVYSTLPQGKYGYLTGTSQAAPVVTGIAAMLLAKYPNLTSPEVIRIISESVDRIPNLKGKVSSGGKVNAYRALLLAKKKHLQTSRLDLE